MCMQSNVNACPAGMDGSGSWQMQAFTMLRLLKKER